MKKRIVFVNQSSGYLMIDIIQAFEKDYDERVIIAGSINPRKRKLTDDITIHTVQAYDNTTILKRMLTWSMAFIKMLFIIKTRYRDAELFLVSNPPFTVFIPLFCNNPFSYLVYDIYPDAITASGISHPDSLPVRIWTSINKKVYKKARKVFTISDGMKKTISNNVEDSKIQVIPLWTDELSISRIKKSDNIFLKEQGLEDKFVVLYSGNLGISHDVEVIIDIAEKFIYQNKFFFLVIGEGEKRESLSSMILKKSLKNCRLLPLQPKEKLPYTFSAADMAVVTLSSFASNLSVPSKTFNYLSAGAPLLCVASDESELALLVAKYEVGRCFNREAVDCMVQYIKDVMADPVYQRHLQANALNVSKDFTRKNAEKFVDALR